jgi:hypothetical protein
MSRSCLLVAFLAMCGLTGAQGASTKPRNSFAYSCLGSPFINFYAARPAHNHTEVLVRRINLIKTISIRLLGSQRTLGMPKIQSSRQKRNNMVQTMVSRPRFMTTRLDLASRTSHGAPNFSL